MTIYIYIYIYSYDQNFALKAFLIRKISKDLSAQKYSTEALYI